MHKFLSAFCMASILANTATADFIPTAFEEGCGPCTFVTETGTSVDFNYSLDDTGFLASVSFDEQAYDVESDARPADWQFPPLVRVDFSENGPSDIYAVRKFQAARNAENYYFLHDAEGMHLLGHAPSLTFDSEQNVFEGFFGFAGGAEVSRYIIQNRKLVLIGTETIEIDGE